MRAAIVREIGAVPELGELSDPTPAQGEALVEVRAAALNPIDIAIASGRFYAGPPHVPYAPGREGVGVVVEGGAVSAGARVRFERDTGYGANGSLAELIVVDEDALVPLPDEAEDSAAAALGIAGLAAWLALGKAELQQGETVLVLGATGAVGQVAVQGAKLLGSRTVVAAARNADALERTRQLGADVLVPLGDGELAEAFTSAAGGEIDAVIDPLWGAPAVAALGALRIGGRLVHLGTSAGLEANVPSAPLRGKNLRIIGHSNLTTPHDVKARAFRELLDHVIAGRIHVDVDVFPLERVADAWREQAASPHRKIVVTP
jgi:NADPH:quinone reductase-like Zn-dependent oxidoreductase